MRKWASGLAAIVNYRGELANLRKEVDDLRSRADLPPTLLDEFQTARATAEYQAAFTKPEPLVTVCVGTFNRAELVTTRCLASICAQTYRNLQIIVIGDACTDDTAARIAALGDPRITFRNLPTRSVYPTAPELRWMVAGSIPFNHALADAKGDFVTHLDDDDEFVPDRIARLLAFAQSERADMVWHPFWFEPPEGGWRVNPARGFLASQVTTSAVFYHGWLARVPWDPNAYRYREPGDWNRFRKIRYLGAKCVRYPDPLTRHYRERAQAKRPA